MSACLVINYRSGVIHFTKIGARDHLDMLRLWCLKGPTILNFFPKDCHICHFSSEGEERLAHKMQWWDWAPPEIKHPTCPVCFKGWREKI